MKLKDVLLNLGLAILLCLGFSSNSQENKEVTMEMPRPLKIISLGDSYTIGESVCRTCRFPEQLKDSIKQIIDIAEIDLKIIATTGWTTSVLLNALNQERIEKNYDLATLLIGVNNQFQGKPFDQFETQFPELTNKAITYAKGLKKNLIVLSIPDYAFTPYGAGRESISNAIDTYNNFIQNYCEENQITYVYITDITRKGLEAPELIASDGLHPSTLAYSKFVARILPFALEKIDYNGN